MNWIFKDIFWISDTRIIYNDRRRDAIYFDLWIL